MINLIIKVSRKQVRISQHSEEMRLSKNMSVMLRWMFVDREKKWTLQQVPCKRAKQAMWAKDGQHKEQSQIQIAKNNKSRSGRFSKLLFRLWWNNLYLRSMHSVLTKWNRQDIMCCLLLPQFTETTLQF